MPKPLSCDHQDYLEIACLFHYDVCVQTQDGTEIVGTAHTLGIDSNKQERLYFKPLDVDTKTLRSATTSVMTSDIVKLTVLTSNARFTQIDFR